MLGSAQGQYHVTPNGGAYSGNNGSFGQPWSLAGLNDALELGPSIIPNGSIIYFHDGVHRGELIVTGRNELTFEAYDNANPIISGADLIDDLVDPEATDIWEFEETEGGTYIWSATLDDIPYSDLRGTSERERLYLYRPISTSTTGSKLLPLARTPNEDTEDEEASWYRMEGWTNNSIIDDAVTALTLPTTSTQAVVRTTNWSYDVVNLASKTGNTLVFHNAPHPFNGGAAQPPFQYISDFGETFVPGWGYFLRNYYDAIDQEDEWFAEEDGSNSKVYLATSSNQPPEEIEVGVRERCVTLENCSLITFRDITFEKAYYGISAYGSNTSGITGIRVESCTFQHLFNGIEATYAPGSKNEDQQVDACLFRECYNIAVVLVSEGASVLNNTIEQIGEIPGRGATAWGYLGIRSFADNTLIENNQLTDIGFAGLMVEGDDVELRHNAIQGALTTLNDGGAIFFEKCDNMLIEGNLITNSFGNLTSVSTEANSNQAMAAGIYFGQATTTNAKVLSNTVSNCEVGMIVDHNLENAPSTGPFPVHTIENNTLFNNRSIQLFITDQSSRFTPGTSLINEPLGVGGDAYAPAFTDTYQGNILYSLNARQRNMAQVHIWSASYTDLVDYGTFTNNYYFNPFSPTPIHVAQYYTNSGGSLTSFWMPRSLSRWQELTGKDLDSHGSPLSLPDATVQNIGDLLIEEDFELVDSEVAWQTTNCVERELDVEGFDGYALRSQGLEACRWVRPANETADVTDYRLQLKISAEEQTGVYLGVRTDVFGELIGIGAIIGPVPQHLTHYFSVPQGVSIRPMIRKADQVAQVHGVATGMTNGFGPDIWIDDVVLEEYAPDNEQHSTQIASNHILRYNCPIADASTENIHQIGVPEGQPSSFTIPGDPGQCWSDVYGNFYAAGEPYELAEWESVVLFRMDATYDIDEAQYLVQGNEVWDSDKKVRGSVIILNERSLTIDGATIEFADSRQGDEILTNIVVQPGGTLNIINGAHLTTLQDCGSLSMWDGVKVLGNVDPNDPQGKVNMLSGSRISNALVGILAGEGDPMTPGFAGPEKNGWISCFDAEFENNRFDVVVHGLPAGEFTLDYWDIPFFSNTQFLTTAQLNYADLDPVAHVRIADHSMAKFYDCVFDNQLPTHTESHRMGHGIEGFNAQVAVWPYDVNEPGTSRFSNLDHGIHLSTSSGTPYATVVRSTFTDNICGLYLADLPGFAVRGNEVEMGRWSEVELTHLDEELWLDHQRGIFSTGGYGFNMSENVLGRSANGTALTEGIVVGYTREHNDIVFDNAASGLDVGFTGEGVSADVSNILGNANTQGLQFQCNTNQNNEVNIWSRKINGAVDEASHTIRGFQGANGTDLSPARAASNTFDRTPGKEDFRVSTENLPQIRYFHKASPLSKIPLYYTTGTVSLVPEEIPASALDACATPGIWPGGGKPALRAEVLDKKEAHGNLRYLLAQLVDGGNTDAVVQEIVDAWPQDIWDLRTYLLSMSPYLSVDALMQLVNKDVPLAIKAEILIANPEATQKDGFLKWAEYHANYPLPEYILASVVASWDIRTYRTTLEMQMADKHTAMTQAANGLLYSYHTDTVPANPDSLRWVWQQVRTNGARYAEAALLLGQGRFIAAEEVVQSMPAERTLKTKEEQERQRMLTYIGVLAAAAADDRNAYQLNAQEVNTLEQMARDHYDRPSNWANNLLCAVYKKCRAPWTGGTADNKSRNYRLAEATTEQEQYLRLQPNPSRTYVAVDYLLPGAENAAQLTVRDLTGRSLHQQRITGPQGQVLMDTRMFGSGTYLVVIESEGRIVATERLVVQQ